MGNEYRVNTEGYAEIIITGKHSGIVIVDIDDVERLQEYTWCISKASKTSTKDYIKTTSKGKTIRIHRFIIEANEDELVDHRNRNTLDNRRKNLRKSDKTGNAINCGKRSDNKSGKIGVTRFKAGHWLGFYHNKSSFISKSFSVSKYGEEEAFRLACKFRKSLELKFKILSG
jgi:hypothetical protein